MAGPGLVWSELQTQAGADLLISQLLDCNCTALCWCHSQLFMFFSLGLSGWEQEQIKLFSTQKNKISNRSSNQSGLFALSYIPTVSQAMKKSYCLNRTASQEEVAVFLLSKIQIEEVQESTSPAEARPGCVY